MSLTSPEKEKGQFLKVAVQMYDELRAWRAKHPQASFDEIAAQVTPRRQELRGQLLAQLACQHGNGVSLDGQRCLQCGQSMVYKGQPSRGVVHLEGETELARAYYYCPTCQQGLFPPGSSVTTGPAQLDAGDD